MINKKLPSREIPLFYETEEHRIININSINAIVEEYVYLECDWRIEITENDYKKLVQIVKQLVFE